MGGRDGKRLLGFGWRGIIALIVLAAIAVPYARGVDLRWLVMSGLFEIAPELSYNWIVPRYVLYVIVIDETGFGPFMLLWVPIVFVLLPERIGVWRTLPFVVYCVLAPVLHIVAVRSLSLSPRFKMDALSIVMNAGMWLTLIAIGLWLFSRAVRNRRMVMFIAAWAAVAYAHELVAMISGGSVPYRSDIAAIVWQGAAAAVLISWAWRRRTSRVIEGHCVCGYPLGGFDRCPECGAMHDGAAPSIA